MSTQPIDGQGSESKLFIIINDFTDSDNEATAELWAWLLNLDPTVKGIYIAEPRWVNLGYYMTNKDFGRCMGLVKKLQPPLEGSDSPLTTVYKQVFVKIQGGSFNLGFREKRCFSKYIFHLQIHAIVHVLYSTVAVLYSSKYNVETWPRRRRGQFARYVN
jgi:hypothetical protein